MNNGFNGGDSSSTVHLVQRQSYMTLPHIYKSVSTTRTFQLILSQCANRSHTGGFAAVQYIGQYTANGLISVRLFADHKAVWIQEKYTSTPEKGHITGWLFEASNKVIHGTVRHPFKTAGISIKYNYFCCINTTSK